MKWRTWRCDRGNIFRRKEGEANNVVAVINKSNSKDDKDLETNNTLHIPANKKLIII
jgi:hypothetical protein